LIEKGMINCFGELILTYDLDVSVIIMNAVPKYLWEGGNQKIVNTTDGAEKKIIGTNEICVA
jgi:hypothetical protein